MGENKRSGREWERTSEVEENAREHSVRKRALTCLTGTATGLDHRIPFSDAVGFLPSSLIQNSLTPRSSLISEHAKNGVFPTMSCGMLCSVTADVGSGRRAR